MDLFGRVDPAEVAAALGADEIPWTLDRAVAVFLNRWCHRALGERDAAERELRALIARAKERD